MERLTSRSQRIGPKVHKNHRIENKWGRQYHQAIQNIAFGRHCSSYMPTEPPASLSEEIVESGPLYVCKQCKDCFRFQSSFEDHNTRHSWILGLWCQNCFLTVCTHITQSSNVTGAACVKCSACTQKENNKRAYVRARNIKDGALRHSGTLWGGHRWGAVKVFYNQCKFIEHLKMHQLSHVNMGDLMLLPLPVNMSNSDWSSEFEILCEALMERAFLLGIHIIDWLKIHKLQDDWWKLVNGKSNDNMINKIVNGYQGRQLFGTYDQSTANMSMDFSYSNVTHDVSKSPVDIELIDDSSMDSFMDKNTNNYSANIISQESDRNIVENEDNPCTPTDITFVDCGPTSQCFEPEIPVNYTHNKQVTAQVIKRCYSANTKTGMINKTNNEGFKDHNLHGTDMNHENAITVKAGDNGSNKNLIIKESSKDCVQQQYNTVQPLVKKIAENNHSKTGVSKVSDNPVKIGIPLPAKKSTITKTNLDHFEHSLQTSRTNNNSKVLTIQDPKNITSIISQLPSHLISNKKLVVIGQDSRNIRNIIAYNASEVATKTDSNISVADNSGTNSNTSTQKMCDSNVKKQEVTGKIIVRNGKRYLIKRTNNIIKDPKSSKLSIVRNATKATKQPTSEQNTSKSRLTLTNSNEIEIIDMEQTASLHNNVSLLTPSPSPSELSSSSSCELHVKKSSVMPQLQKVPPHLMSIPGVLPSTPKYLLETISLIKEDNGDLYMDIKDVCRIQKESFTSVCDIIIKYRREMFDEFKQMNSLELKERFDHLQCVSEEMRQVLNFMSAEVFTEKLRAINTLQYLLTAYIEEWVKIDNQDVQDKQSNDVILNEWETMVDPVNKCLICNKVMKPKSYIAGFSKLPTNDEAYCFCYKRVCHICLSYQGTTPELIAHQNFHKNKKSEPYVCPTCNFKFNSATSLEVHTWTFCFHTSRKQVFNCKICEIDGFRDLESITRHFVIMHSKTKVGCEDCSRVFSSYNEYVQHCTKAHPSKMEQNPVRLVICKLSNVILRCEDYMSYLEKYPGIRKLIWFKCPFCNLITTDNKHVTTLLNKHMRNNHVESLLKVLSKQAFIQIFGKEFLKKNKSLLQQFLKPTESDENTDGTVVPKIVNTQTISSEIFEHGSQDTKYTWSTDTNKVVNESPMKMKKLDDKEKRELLPQIINIKGRIEDGAINDLKLSKPKEAITKISTETKKQSDPSSLQVIEFEIETKDEKVDLFTHEETAMELDDNKSNSNEETAKTKESDKDNNELTMNALCKSEKPSLVDKVDVHVDSSIVSSNKVSNSTSERSTDSHIKIVDFRKICKPDIEQFVTAEMSDIEIKDENASCMPKPPPLTRIPQHLFEPVEINKPVNEPAISSKKSRLKKSFVRRRVNKKTKVCISLGTDTQEKEVIDFLCHLCNERINTSRYVVQTHFREMHSTKHRLAVITPRLLRMSSDYINGGYKNFINDNKRKSDSDLLPPKKKRRYRRSYIVMKDTPVGLCVERETVEDSEGNFICKKCGQRCTGMPDLREHIVANHRLKGRYLICLICGENFVVAPSLQMHLKAFHAVEDPINYMNQNPSYAPDDIDLQTGEKTTVANQCYVCMAVFEDKAAVDKHLRVHGMAFLNRKRIEARNALEKKTVTEEDKPSIIKNDSKEAAKRDKPAEIILEKINAAI